MRRELVVAFALVTSLLVATAPVAGSHQLATVSIHSTTADFENGSLTNFTASNGEIELSGKIIDSFEDGDISEYTGDTGSFTVDGTSPVKDGSQSLKSTTNNVEIISQSGLPLYPGKGDSFDAWVHGGGDADSGMRVIFGAQDSSNYYAVDVRPNNNRFRIIKQNASGVTVVTEDSVTIANDAWLRVNVDWASDDTITATLFNDSGTQLAQNSTTDSEFATETGFGWSTAPSDGAPAAAFDFATGPSAESAEYISANHTVEDSEQGFVNMTTVTNATVTVTWETNDGSGWSQLNETTGITTAANHTFTWAVESNDTVRVNVSVLNASGNGVPEFSVADEGVQFTAADPSVNNSSASPTGDLSTSTPTLEIDINDSDFNLSQNDSVEVEFFVGGSSIGTDTLTSNGTASQDVTNTLDGGDHTWNVTATDDYGHSVDSQDFDITVPANLTIRNETSPYDAITDCSANVTFYEVVDDNPTIVERSDENGDGNISLSGLPVDSEFVASIACDGYHTRTILINSLFNQQSAFLVNTTESTIENRFTVEDRSGDFPAEETELIVQKAINRSEYDSSANGFEWTNVAGDELGADESFVTDLIEEDRYRIKVQNDDGDQRILGAYTADTTGTINLIVGRVILDPEATDQPAYEAERTNNSGEPVRVTFEYNDSVENTTKIWLHIYEFNNESNELLANTSFTPSSGNYGTFSNTEDVPSAENDTTWVVDFHAVRDGEDDITAEIVVGGEHDVLPDIPEWLLSIIYVGTLLIVAGLFSQLNADVGALVVAGLGGLFLISGFMPGVIGSGVVLLSMMVAGVLFIQGRRGGGF